MDQLHRFADFFLSIMLISHLHAIRYDRRNADRRTLLRYKMLRVHAFWYDLFRYAAICQFQVTRSVTIESPVLIRSRKFEYDYPYQVQAYHDRGSRFGTIRYAHIRYNTFITVRCALLRLDTVLVSRLP